MRVFSLNVEKQQFPVEFVVTILQLPFRKNYLSNATPFIFFKKSSFWTEKRFQKLEGLLLSCSALCDFPGMKKYLGISGFSAL